MDLHSSPSCASLLYVSELAPGFGALEVAAITRTSRANNRRDGITGLMAYDGESFLQLVQGPPPAVAALLQRLQVDPRHRAIEILLRATGPGRPQFPDWQLGFLNHERCRGSLVEFRRLRGNSALAALLDLVAGLDLLADRPSRDPGEPVRTGFDR